MLSFFLNYSVLCSILFLLVIIYWCVTCTQRFTNSWWFCVRSQWIRIHKFLTALTSVHTWRMSYAAMDSNRAKENNILRWLASCYYAVFRLEYRNVVGVNNVQAKIYAKCEFYRLIAHNKYRTRFVVRLCNTSTFVWLWICVTSPHHITSERIPKYEIP